VRRALAGETVHAHVELDGLYFDSHYCPRRDSQGKIVGALGGATAVTDRERALQAYRRSQSRFRTVARVVPVALFQTDAAGRCVYVNRQWTMLSGLTSEQSMGMGWLAALHPEDRERVAAGWAQAI